MAPVRITVAAGSRTVSVDDVHDSRVAAALRTAGEDVARRLERIRCPVHDKAATNVRVHFDAQGSAQLQYDSCCEQLGTTVSRALG